jgi:hypothetical protein|tara:strand:+ start:174 stop:374 length:201 start_codon:yes stop_codon:yes gene_type:complete
MLITKTSILSGKTRTKEINVNQSQIDKWVAGMLIQDAMPNISVDEREFIMTGSTPEEWDLYFNEEG